MVDVILCISEHKLTRSQCLLISTFCLYSDQECSNRPTLCSVNNNSLVEKDNSHTHQRWPKQPTCQPNTVQNHKANISNSYPPSPRQTFHSLALYSATLLFFLFLDYCLENKSILFATQQKGWYFLCIVYCISCVLFKEKLSILSWPEFCMMMGKQKDTW